MPGEANLRPGRKILVWVRRARYDKLQPPTSLSLSLSVSMSPPLSFYVFVSVCACLAVPEVDKLIPEILAQNG